MRASARQLRRLAAALPRLYSLRDSESLLLYILAILPRIVATDLLAFDEFRGGRVVRQILTPLDANLPANREAFEVHFHEHPIVNHQRRTGERRPVKLSDFVSRRQYHRLGLYCELFRHFGVESQISFPVNNGRDHLLGIALARSRGDFTEAERDILCLLQPHLAQAWRNACAVTKLLTEPEPHPPLRDARQRQLQPDRWRFVDAQSMRCLGLTARECEVLGWVSRGKSNADTAVILGVSPLTVKKHLEHVYDKLGVGSRTAAVAVVLRSVELAAQ